METSVWIAVAIIALGTFSMRFMPMLWMKKHLESREGGDTPAEVPQWLVILGPLMVSGMFGVTLTPQSPDFGSWLATAAGVIATLITWRITRSLGLPVLFGVVTFGALYFAF
jgi:branched-subunit amino acid transport protein AzlD